MKRILLIILICLLFALNVTTAPVLVGKDTDFSGGDVTGDYFYGDGSNLTNVGSATATGLTIDAKEENTSTIVKGQPVYNSGSAGVAKSLIGLADSDATGKAHVIGLAAEAFSQNGNGTIRVGGLLAGVDSLGTNAVNPNGETWAAGDIIYLSTTTGGLTNVRPTSGHEVEVGHSLYGSSNTDAILVHLGRPREGLSVGAADNMYFRLGASDDSTSISIKDFANAEVANIDDGGSADFTDLILDTPLAVAEGGTGSGTLASEQLSDRATIAMLDENEAITGEWVFDSRLAITYLHDDWPPDIAMKRSRDGDPTSNVANNDGLGEISFRGYHTSAYVRGALIQGLVDGTPGDYDMPGRLEFLTTRDGYDYETLRMAIDSAGNIKMGDGGWVNYINVTAGGAMTAEGTASIKATDLVIASQAAGDILYFNGTNWIRLAKGTAGQVLTMNAGGTAPEWQTP